MNGAFRSTATNVVDLTRDAAAHLPDHDAYVEFDARVTYREYERAADGLATLLADWGVTKGSVVCLALGAGIDYAICYQAALRLGAIASGINLRLGPPEQLSIVSRLRPTVTITDVDTVVPGPTGRLLSRADLAAAYAIDPDYGAPRLGADDVVAVVWTSGTTDAPKGAVYDHRRLAAMARGAGPMSQPGDRRIYPLPFAHSGYMTRLWDEISNGIACIIPPPNWRAEDSLVLFERERVTVGQGVPTQWELMLRHPRFDEIDVSSMRIAAMGAASIPADLVREVRRRFGCPVVVRYTSTEACVTTSTRPSDPVEAVANTVGQPVAGVELDLVDSEGRSVEPGQVGRIRCRSDAVMKEYWRDPELTAGVLDPAGWLSTGDLGYVDGDGNLRITGRLSDMYVRGGYNVYPLQVEQVLEQHPQIADVAVIGVPAPVRGEIGVAFVVAAGAPTLTLEQLRDWAGPLLADYKLPDQLVSVTAIPRTSMGKIDRRALAASLPDLAGSDAMKVHR